MDRIEKAREVAKRQANNFNKWGFFRYSPKEMIKRSLHNQPVQYDEVLELAKEHSVVYDALVEFCSDAIENNKAVPAPLSGFIAQVLRGDTKRPRQRGPHPSENTARNFTIAQSVHEVVCKTGINATRNDESGSVSACDLVADAFRDECNLSLSYDTVKKIYLNINK